MSLREAAEKALNWIEWRDANIHEWFREGISVNETLRNALAEAEKDESAEAVTAERDALLGMVDKQQSNWESDLDAARKEMDRATESSFVQMRKEIVALRADAERIEFVENNPEHESMPYYEDGKWVIPYEVSNAGGYGGGVGLVSYETFRDAIDAAMKGE